VDFHHHGRPPVTRDEAKARFRDRSTARTDVAGAARMRPFDRTMVEIVVRNVSTSGFMADCPEPVRIGCSVWLEVPGLGAVEAQVRWQIGGRMGGMFTDPISLEHCQWAVPLPEPQEPAAA
jgi:hypothetical protein